MPGPEDRAPAPSRVNLVDPTGAIVNADRGDVDGLLSDGYSVASPELVQSELERQQYGEGLGNQAAAFGEGLLSGATVGLSDVAAKAIAPEYAERLAKRREYLPTEAMVGEGVGILGSALLTGGATAEGALARGALGAAKVATAPARALIGAGEAVAGASLKALGAEAAQGVLGQALRTGAAYGLSGATEGALFGAAKVATDDFLNDHEITAERIAAGAGTGALWGGVLAGGMGAAGSLASSGAKGVANLFNRSDADRLASQKIDDILHGTANSDASATGAGSADFDVGVGAGSSADAVTALDVDQKLATQVGFRSDDEIVAEMASGAGDVERQGALAKLKSMGKEADAAKNFERLQQQKTLEFTKLGNSVSKTADDLQEVANVGLKPDAFKPLMELAPPNYEVLAPSTASKLDDIQNVLKSADGDRHLYQPVGLNGIKRANDAIDAFKDRAFERATKEALDTPEAASAYMADVDMLKRNLGRIQNGVKGDPNARAIIKDAYHELMRHLEDASVFGEAATKAQHEINGAWTRYLDYADAMSSDFGLSNSTTRSARDGFEKVAELDPAKVGGMMRSLGRSENSKKEAVWLVGLERKADLLETLAKWYDVPSGMKSAVSTARRDTQAMVSGMRELRALNELSDSYTQQLQTLRDLPFGGETLAKLKINLGKSVSLASSAEQQVSAASAASSLSRSDARSAGRVAAESGAAAHDQVAVRMATEGERKVEGASRGVLAWVAATGKAAATKTARAARATAETIAAAGPLMGVDMVLSKPETYERAVRNIAAMRDPQSDERRTVRARVYGLRQSNPMLADAIEAHTQRVADFLAEKAGEVSVTPKAGDPFGGLRKPRHSAEKAAKLARYIDAAQNPSHALDRISKGDITREDVEVLQTLYPRLYQRVVTNVLSRMGDVDKLPSYEQRLKLGHLLNAPADPSMIPERAAALQELARSGAQPAAQNAADSVGQPVLAPSDRRAPSKLSGMYSTQADRYAAPNQ
jgi:hypothetical protein